MEYCVMKTAMMIAAGMTLSFVTFAMAASPGGMDTPTTPAASSAIQATAAADDTSTAATDNKANDNGGDEQSASSGCCRGKLGDPWTLPQPQCLKDRNITIGGWLDRRHLREPIRFAQQRAGRVAGIGDGFTADQVWFFAERKTDTKGCGWDYGRRVDTLFGTDATQTQALATIPGITIGTRATRTVGPCRNSTVKSPTTI